MFIYWPSFSWKEHWIIRVGVIQSIPQTVTQQRAALIGSKELPFQEVIHFLRATKGITVSAIKPSR